jgi:hypothetical protein
MIRMGVAWSCAALAVLFAFWRESGENTLVFCYRMGSRLYVFARTGEWRRLQSSRGELAACSNPYNTYSTRSTMSKD